LLRQFATKNYNTTCSQSQFIQNEFLSLIFLKVL
jgi:hypothetical protein